MRPSFAAALLTALVGCGGPSSPSPDAGALKCHQRPLQFSGAPGQVTAAQLVSNVFTVPATVGATATRLLVDTGAPVTIFDLGALPGEPLPLGQGPFKRFETSGLTFDDATVVGADLNLTLPSGRLAGILGGDLLCHFSTSFNYRDLTLTLGQAAIPANLEAGTSTPIGVVGGGLGALPVGGQNKLVSIPPTRITVDVMVEGVLRHFVVDSGASFTVVTAEVFEALIKDGRKMIDMIPAQTVMGTIGTRITRVRSLTIGGAEVKGSLVSSLDGMLLQQLALEVRGPVDGLIGGTFLRDFYVTADYPNEQLTLARYTTRTHIADEFVRLGIAIKELQGHTPGTPRYTIERVFAGSDAATRGLAAGDKLLEVDGVKLESVDPIAAEALMLGVAGTSKQLLTDTGTFSVAIEDLLPLQ